MPNRRIPTLVEYRDSSGNGHDGTVIGAEWAGGILGSALDFDGVDDYVLCAERTGNGPGIYPEQLMPQTFTVACWTKLDNFAYFSSFVGNGIDTGGDECGFFLYNWGWVDENEQDFGLAIRTETGMSYVETPNIYQANTWYHLAATYDGADVRIYVDGSLAAGPTNVGGPLRTTTSRSDGPARLRRRSARRTRSTTTVTTVCACGWTANGSSTTGPTTAIPRTAGPSIFSSAGGTVS
jgi:hypothetical protein